MMGKVAAVRRCPRSACPVHGFRYDSTRNHVLVRKTPSRICPAWMKHQSKQGNPRGRGRDPQDGAPSRIILNSINRNVAVNALNWWSLLSKKAVVFHSRSRRSPQMVEWPRSSIIHGRAFKMVKKTTSRTATGFSEDVVGSWL